MLGLSTFKRALTQFIWTPVIPNKYRARLLVRVGIESARNAFLAPNSIVMNPPNLSLGEGVFVNEGCYFDAGPISLGDNVFLGPRVVIITANHPVGPKWKRAADGEHSFVSVGSGSWLGAGVIVLPGVTIGEGCVIAAGAVVNRDCAPNGIYAGVPARRVKDLSDE